MQKLQQISSRIFYLPPVQVTDRPILAAIVGEDRTLLIDAGNSSRHAKLFIAQLEERNMKGDWLVITHWHWDHIFGISEYQVPIICHSKTQEKIKELRNLSWEDNELDQRVREGTEIPFCADAMKIELGNQREIHLKDPDMTFETRLELNLGGLHCVIEHVGGDHSADSSIIYIREERCLFVGDCLYANLYSKKWNYTIEKMLQLISQIEKYDAEIFILSHEAAPLTKEEFRSFIQLLKNSILLTQKYEGDQEAISREMTAILQRELNESEIETIEYFVNGFS